MGSKNNLMQNFTLWNELSDNWNTKSRVRVSTDVEWIRKEIWMTDQPLQNILGKQVVHKQLGNNAAGQIEVYGDVYNKY